MAQIQEGQEQERKPAETGAEDGEGVKASWSKGELLDFNAVAQSPEMLGDEVTGSCRLGGAGFSRECQEVPRDLVDPTRILPVCRQDDAARFGRRPAAKVFPAVVNAARWVSAVIRPASMSSSRCWS
jgi:hypothetical protein